MPGHRRPSSITYNAREDVVSSSDVAASAPAAEEYRVLARKYRPQSFDDLIGQDALVRTLSNAIEMSRIAHAFLLTGIRGIGKTTTARIIARSLNCVGPDGTGGPTINPCGVCEHCVAIKDDRHQDVLEMDAASRTGVNDIREIIENARYLPTSARYKIYIIDEVHMLSTSAFNALLKTLEEPPQHVKFIFATTELRKIPITILSRCQRFDLKRIDHTMLAQHLQTVAEKEHFSVEAEALTLLTKAAEGSVRDGLSLLDQAISYSHTEGTKTVGFSTVQHMLGTSSKSLLFDLLDHLIKGDITSSLEAFHTIYSAGGDPALILKDLLEVSNLIMRVKVCPALVKSQYLSDVEAERSKQLSDVLSIPFLSRMWQILLKGIQEVSTAPSAVMAAEMVLIRLAYVSDLPSPAEYIKTQQQQTNGSSSPTPAPGGSSGADSVSSAPVTASVVSSSGSGAITAAAPSVAPHAVSTIDSFAAFVDLFKQHKEPLIYHTLYHDAHLVAFEAGRVEVRLAPSASTEVIGKISERLKQYTGERWIISVSHIEGAPTLHEQALKHEQEALAALKQHPNVAAVLDAFPGADVVHIIEPQPETESVDA